MSILWYFMSIIPSILSLSTVIDYTLVDSGKYIFSTSLNDTYIINSYDNLETCKDGCSNSSLCVGVSNMYNNSVQTCNLLTELGTPMSTSLNISSYRKLTRYYDDDDTHTIYGFIETSGLMFELIDTDVYIDMNHNGKHEVDEPITTSYNGNFNFTDVKDGTYLIREVTPPTCTQLLPGVWGYGNTIDGDGYVDNIVYLHTYKNEITGGNLDNSNLSISSDFVLGDNQNTYLTFFPDDTITVSFVDETIIDTPGVDLIINTYNNSSTQAHVSVSHNDVDYVFIGVLNTSNTGFDLSILNYTQHISYIKLHFFGDNHTDGINIVSVKVVDDSIFSPSFGFMVSVPLNPTYTIFFINDCHYWYWCDLHCMFGTLDQNEALSCYSGCQLFDKTYQCKCEEEDVIKHEINYTDTFIKESCVNGCEYEMNQYMFPDFKVYKNSVGTSNPANIINKLNIDYCTSNENYNCLNKFRNKCDRRDMCESISIGDNHLINYNNTERYYDEGSYLIVKSELIGPDGLDYITTSTTSSTHTSTSTTSSTHTSTSTTSSTHTSTSTTSSTHTSTSTTSSTHTSTSTSSSTQNFTRPTNDTTTSSTVTDLSSSTPEPTTVYTNLTNNHTHPVPYNTTVESNTRTTVQKNTSTQTVTTTSNRIVTNPSDSDSSKDDDDNDEMVIIFSIFGALAFIVLAVIIYTLIFCKKTPEVPTTVPENRTTTSFENPMYTNNDLYQNSLPEEPHTYDEDANYIDIK